MTRTCGRPTKQGSPCTRVLQPWEMACITHATAADQEVEYQILKAQQAARRVTCPCPCHAVVAPGLVPCPQCDPPLVDPPPSTPPLPTGASAPAKCSGTPGPFTPLPPIFPTHSAAGGDGS